MLDRKTAMDEEQDRRDAFIVAHIVNWSGYAKKTHQVKDFIKKRRRKKQTLEDMQTMMLALNAALGGEVIINAG